MTPSITTALTITLAYACAAPAFASPADSASTRTVAASASAPRDDGARTGDDLDASWQEPWNPDAAIPGRRGWERAVLLPGRIASLPLSAVGRGVDYTFRWVEDRGWIPNRPPAERDRVRHGVFAIEPPLLGGAAGIGAAGVVRYGVLPGRARVQVLLRQAFTHHHYGETAIGLIGSPGWLDYRYDWRPQDSYYGEGPVSRLEDRTDFATQLETVRLGVRATRGAAKRPGGLTAFAVWTGPRSALTLRGREPQRASIEDVFPDAAAPVLGHRVDHEVYGLQLLHDGRRGEPHWVRGWRGLLDVERFGAPLRPFALHTARDEGARFWAATGELESAVSWWRDPRTLRALVRVEHRHVMSGRERFLPADLGTLGGAAGLGGFNTSRFRGLDVLLGRLSYVFPVSRRLELDLHSEWGNAFEDLRDAKPSRLEHSAGVALRVRWERGPVGAIGFDVSREALRLHYALGGVR